MNLIVLRLTETNAFVFLMVLKKIRSLCVICIAYAAAFYPERNIPFISVDVYSVNF